MKLYYAPRAPNPRRVQMFMAEKGITGIALVPVDLNSGEHFGADYRAKSPQAKVPALELDDGRILTETRAICSYLEGLYPETNLMGADFDERAFVEMADRRVEWAPTELERRAVDDASIARGDVHAVAVVRVQCERLLAQHVCAGFDRLEHEIDMGVGRRRHRDRVDAEHERIRQRRARVRDAEVRRTLSRSSRIAADERHHFEACGLERGHVDASAERAADHGHP